MKKSLLLLVLFLIAGMTAFIRTQSESQITIGTFSFFENTIPEERTPIFVPTDIVFVGDVMLARRVETYLDTYGTEYVYSELPLLSSSTVLVGNFEAAIPKEHTQTPDLTFSFSVDKKVIPALSQYGFTQMSLANNHSFDKGANDFLYTQNILEKEGIEVFGNPKNFATTSISYTVISTTTVALIGLYTLEKEPLQGEINTLIKEARKNSDFQIAYMHWGNEYEPIHTSKQQILAEKLIDSGVDLVIGNHPHVVQDIQQYKGSLIFYSLGNFIFDQYFSKDVQEGLWVTLSFKERKPVYILQGITSIGSRSVPRFMASYENDIFLKALAKKSDSRLERAITIGNIAP